jgi:hypothetical protein
LQRCCLNGFPHLAVTDQKYVHIASEISSKRMFLKTEG